MDFNIEDYKIIKFSGYFDLLFYIEKYPDVKIAGIEPLIHFLLFGWKEGRNPSNLFDTKFYLSTYPDVKNSGINPLLHFILHGKKEGRKCVKNIAPETEERSFFHEKPCIPEIKTSNPIDILIPVYNGLNFLKTLLHSIIKNTYIPYRLLIADDNSPNREILPFLKNFQKIHKNINLEIFQNRKNLGFIKTVNKLVNLTNNHFVILNTDTEVPSNWLERLIFPIVHMEKVASATPFTNSGLFCSFPEYLKDNPLPENLNVEQIDNIFKLVNFQKTYIEMPTGVGFCMAINKNVVDKIGFFDETFGKGYGEENDWCQRAIESGYKNIHVTNLFVYHKHGGSFPKKEKNRLIDENSIKLLKKFPSFSVQMQVFIENNSLKKLRNEIKKKLLENYSNL